MFFVLSKVFGFFASPSNLVILVGILGLLLLPPFTGGHSQAREADCEPAS